MKSRKGKHKAGNVRMGIYVEPHRKAVALLAARTSGSPSMNMRQCLLLWKL